eukprot:UN13530
MKLATFKVICVENLKRYEIIIVIYSDRKHLNSSFLTSKGSIKSL